MERYCTETEFNMTLGGSGFEWCTENLNGKNLAVRIQTLYVKKNVKTLDCVEHLTNSAFSDL
jgi:hypothetical protein